MERELNEEELQDLFAWIDKIPLSRPKRHITRDFSDAGSKVSLAVLMEVLTKQSSSNSRSNMICIAPCLQLR